MIRCPCCKYEGMFNNLRGPWKYGIWEVKMLECPKCGCRFNYYSGTTKDGRRSEFVVRVIGGDRAKA